MPARSASPYQPVAVVGAGAIFAGSPSKEGFWRDTLAGKDQITEVPRTHWLVDDYYDPDPSAPDKTYGRRGSFLPAVDFDPMEFGIPPANMPATDTSQLLALMVARQVLEDVMQGPFTGLDRDRVSVILGVASTTELVMDLGARLQRPVWVKALRESGLPEDEVQQICDRISDSYVPWQESSFPGLLANVVAGRIAHYFDLGGTNCVLDAACAGSLAATHMAIMELASGTSDLVITGGVDTLNHILMYTCFSKTPALSPTGDCRPFSAAADGTILGEGLCMLALKRLDDAERDEDRIYAVIRGAGTSSDGRASSIYAPRSSGQSKALLRAYEQAGYSPSTVELVEAHGTATKAGDAAEFGALNEVFGATASGPVQWCGLGSVKSQIGHTKSTAGAAGLFKVVMALHHKILPPTIKVEQPNPCLDFEHSPFYLNTETRPWIRNGDHPRRGSVSSFGFGGTNFHLALEEYQGVVAHTGRIRTCPTELVLIGADTPEDVATRARQMVAEIAPDTLQFLAHQSQLAFDAGSSARLAIVAGSEEELQERLTQAAEKIENQPAKPFSLPSGMYYGIGPVAGDIAFLFPGQGSQYVGMGADLAMTFDRARAVWDDAAARVVVDGQRLHEAVFPRPVFSAAEREEQARHLTSTDVAQPAIGLASLAQLELLSALGLRPALAGGHSFGEVTALHAASVLDRESFMRVAQARGQLMAAAAADIPGAMTAVLGPVDDLLPRIDRLGLDVVAANLNSPEQAVFAGPVPAIEALETWLTGERIKYSRLPVATAFHSKLVEPSVVPFAELLHDVTFEPAAIPVYANSRAYPYSSDAEEARKTLAQQIAQSVLFADQIRNMYEAGARIFLEVGPGSTLTGLVGRILGDEPHLAINLDRKGKQGITTLWHALGRLSAAGVELKYASLWAEYTPPQDPRQRKKPVLSIPISGANYGKPYPPSGGTAALPPPNPPRTDPPTPQPEIAESASAPDSAPEDFRPPYHEPQRVEDENSAPLHLSPGYLQAIPEGTTSVTTSNEHLAILQAYQELQRQLAETQTAFQRSMAESHMAYLRVAESSSGGLAALISGGLPSAPAPAPGPVHRAPAPTSDLAPAATQRREPLDATFTTNGSHPNGSAAISDLEVILPPTPPKAPPPPIREAPASVPAPALSVAPTLAPLPASEAVDLPALLLAVVADKTGYPVEMLNLDMALEADLGIDSIKRVEILSALRERTPDLPEVEPSQLATLETLGAIVAFMNAGTGASDDGASSPSPLVIERVERATAKLDRSVVRAVSAPATGQAMSGLLDATGPIVVTDDGQGIAACLVERLCARGVPASLATTIPSDAAGVICLAGLRHISDAAAAMAANEEAFGMAQALGAGSIHARLFVTIQDTGGDFGLSGNDTIRAGLAGLAGLAKTAALEWPDAAVKAIDLQSDERSPEELAEALATELLAGGAEREVGLRADGSRLILLALPVHGELGSLTIDERSVIVVTGGARGVTSAALIALARQAHPRIALLGRTPLADEAPEHAGIADEAGLKRALLESARAEGRSPSPRELAESSRQILAMREVRATLRALEEAGSPALYFSVDVQDESAVAAAIGSIREQWGPITGIVHGAGVLADRRIALKTIEQFRQVFGVKVRGLHALLAATASDPLDHIVLFSSVAARTGNVGQSDYAMANEVLNKLAWAEAHRRGNDCLVRSLGWGPWDGGMVDSTLRSYFQQQAIALIPLASGAAAFVDELRQRGHDQVEVVLTARNESVGTNGVAHPMARELVASS